MYNKIYIYILKYSVCYIICILLMYNIIFISYILKFIVYIIIGILLMYNIISKCTLLCRELAVTCSILASLFSLVSFDIPNV